MIRSILCGVDGLPGARAALRVAAQLARETDASALTTPVERLWSFGTRSLIRRSALPAVFGGLRVGAFVEQLGAAPNPAHDAPDQAHGLGQCSGMTPEMLGAT